MLRLYLGAALTVGVLACGGTPSVQNTADAGPSPDAGLALSQVPDFALQDTNSTSATAGEAVSPRRYLQKVSGWYFTHAS